MSDWDSEYYKKHALAQESASLQTLEKLFFNGDEKILDIGCGDGKITYHMAQQVPHGEVIGIDISDNMVQQAKKDYASLSNLAFFKKSAEDFAFNTSFNLITSFFALHWVKDHEKLLKNCLASLEKKGQIFFLFVSGGDPLISEVFMREPWKSRLERKADTFNDIQKDAYDRLLNQFGFTDIHVENVNMSYQFKDLDQLKNHFMTWVPYATGFDHKENERFSKALAHNIASYQNKTTDIDLVTPMLFAQARAP